MGNCLFHMVHIVFYICQKILTGQVSEFDMAGFSLFPVADEVVIYAQVAAPGEAPLWIPSWIALPSAASPRLLTSPASAS